MNKGSSFKLDNDYEKRKAEADRIREKYPDRIPVCPVSCKGFIFMLYALFLDSTYKNMIFGENPLDPLAEWLYSCVCLIM
ncbi:hypothetical protein Bca4012_070990 [Brassica carinata]|uniref:Autophagy-related protein n=2 Tax=Brassica TaxID=3705 RepID=A0A8S9HIB9_BRACR|nr:hypothetical protein F2Q68_00013675 [Brassica cretica]KAG2268728.1 hypothetical protein Bca52824_063283 [Brassica carinata]